MHKKRIKKIIVLFCVSSLMLQGCGKQESTKQEDVTTEATQQEVETISDAEEVDTETIPETAPSAELKDLSIEHNEGGGIDLCISASDFNDSGFAYGDSVNIIFSNGYELTDVPYYESNNSMKVEEILVGNPDASYINVGIIVGSDLWDDAGVSETDTASVTLHKQGKYAGEMLVNSLQYANDRESFESDAAFANFRSVQAGGIKGDVLYRSSSPCNDAIGRAGYADSLISEAGISFILDLADDELTVESYVEDPSFSSEYFKSLYEAGKVKAIRTSSDYTSDGYSEMLVEGLNDLADADGPYLITCLEGRERTGFACVLLECLCGADYDEIKNDYMITYDNYYGINEQSQKENYDLIVTGLLDPMIQTIAGDENADVTQLSLEKVAEDYLLSGGMTSDQIEKLKGKLK